MKKRYALALAAFALPGLGGAIARADDKSEYDRRAAARYMALFQSLDRDSDKAVTKAESRGDLTFSPRFDDMDVDRNGVVTLEELRRFVEREHGVAALAVGR